ncbi:condensation domain-containing protein [Dactylosporangium sp. AC04546]|uniref:condensation domain-containing protein n=1 Tax=Dactylosporangium sp. AC04546 TaxID=2862460 RepID=UPI001EDCB6C1|nr:condensation domain-containing protein [Dactylosporangium sp. AC04546]WVK81196.1 condensation domain-containing protein [Dactylosporangium sp. AC04546]
MRVAFRGAGSGVGELSWGQRELWGGMLRQQTWMPMGIVVPLPGGTTLDDVAAELRFVMERFPSMRTRLRLRADGPPLQVLSAEGSVPIEVVDGEDPGEVSRRLHEAPFDFGRDWPVRTAVVRRDGRLTHQVTVVCHLVNDGFGGVVLGRELDRWRQAGRPAHPGPAPMPPLEQAGWQRSPAGRKQSATALRYWERILRDIEPERFPGAVDPREPRHWQAGFTSRALHLAALAVARRTGTDRTTVLLTAFARALANATGIHPVVVRVVVSNRFRRSLADTVSPVSQPALCVLDVAGRSFDEAVAGTARRALAAYKHAYYDPNDLDALLAATNVDIACYFNDRRPPSPDGTGPAPAAERIAAALPHSEFWWMAKQDRPSERLFLTVEDDPATVRLDLCGDTHHIPPAALEACVRDMETLTVAAAGVAPGRAASTTRSAGG